MKSVDLAAVEKAIAEVAAVEIMPRFRKLAAGDVEMKGVNDPVTVADKAAEKALIARLTGEFPGSVVVGEEGFAEDPAILSRLDGGSDVWVIDPIDGTRHFVDGVPEFGVMVAQVRRKQTVAAWIHDPNTGDTLAAELGGGVWLRGHKMQLAGRDPAVQTVGLTGSKLRKILIRPEIAAVMTDLPPLDLGSAAAFDYARLFTGAAIFADSPKPRAGFLISYRKAMPWDHMAGLMMLAEAGGYSANWQGQAYDPSASDRGLISAKDRLTWDKLYDLLRSVLMSGEVP